MMSDSAWVCAICGDRQDTDEQPPRDLDVGPFGCPWGHAYQRVTFVPDMGLCHVCGERRDSKDHTHCRYDPEGWASENS